MRQFVLIIHEVADYPVWKEVFDNAATMRKSAGECAFQVLACSGDANRIVHFSQWSSLDAARAFFESPELVQIRLDAGVKAPEFIYLDEIESGVL
jgi:heme-degrading monooxygenase HmoA